MNTVHSMLAGRVDLVIPLEKPETSVNKDGGLEHKMRATDISIVSEDT